MSQELRKAQREFRVFRDFVVRSGLPIDFESVEIRRPREPDILCRHLDEGMLAFELAVLADEDLCRSLGMGGSPDFMWTRDPSDRVVANKKSKSYLTPHPVILLLYSDGRLITPDDVVISTLEPLFSSACQFRRVWFMGEGTPVLIYDAGKPELD